MSFAVVIELLCFLVDVNLDRAQGDDDNYNYTNEQDVVDVDDIGYKIYATMLLVYYGHLDFTCIVIVVLSPMV